MCIICLFLFFPNLWSLFFCVLIFLLKNAVFFKKATVSQCFFFLFFLLTLMHSYNVVFGSTYVSISFGIFFNTKKLLLLLDGSTSLWPEIPNFCPKTMLPHSHVWFALQMKVFFRSQMTKPQLKWSIVWSIFHGFSGQKGLIPFWTIFYENDHCGLGDLAFFNIIFCFTSQFTQHWKFFVFVLMEVAGRHGVFKN